MVPVPRFDAGADACVSSLNALLRPCGVPQTRLDDDGYAAAMSFCPSVHVGSLRWRSDGAHTQEGRTGGAVALSAAAPPKPMRPAPDLSVVLPVFNGQATLRRALDSVLQQDVPPGVVVEIVVVDDASTDDTPLMLAE